MSADVEFLQFPQATTCHNPWSMVWRLLLAIAQPSNYLFHLLWSKMKRVKINLSIFQSQGEQEASARKRPCRNKCKMLKRPCAVVMLYPSWLVTVIPPSHLGWKTVMANVLPELSFIFGFDKNLLYSSVLSPSFVVSPLKWAVGSWNFLQTPLTWALRAIALGILLENWCPGCSYVYINNHRILES